MSHLVTASFFITVFLGAGIGAQKLVRDYWLEISAALRGEAPVQRAVPAPLFTVTIRSRAIPIALRRVVA